MNECPPRHPTCKEHHHRHTNYDFTPPTPLWGRPYQAGLLTNHTVAPFLQLHPTFSLSRGFATSPRPHHPRHILVSVEAQKNVNSNDSLSCLDNGPFVILPPAPGPSRLPSRRMGQRENKREGMKNTHNSKLQPKQN